jgi:hypothetical protein
LNELDRKRSYVYAIENHAGIPPFSNVMLANIIYMTSFQIGEKKPPSVMTYVLHLLLKQRNWMFSIFTKKLITSKQQLTNQTNFLKIQHTKTTFYIKLDFY